ncbi:hypothetical protein GM3709_106 [Geminocystis sp. NIES-3709]|nr:hypothetical protein GM3709_106 [Geminocystis sp. NIES-3709]
MLIFCLILSSFYVHYNFARDLLNEGGLVINWSKKFKNKGELINVS